MSGLLKSLARLAFGRGMAGGSRQWLLIGVLSWLVGRAKERADAPPPPVHREVLGPGEVVCIAVYDPPRR
jgi:hypothetical protein